MMTEAAHYYRRPVALPLQLVVSELSIFNRFMSLCSVGERVWCQGGEIKANERERA